LYSAAVFLIYIGTVHAYPPSDVPLFNLLTTLKSKTEVHCFFASLFEGISEYLAGDDALKGLAGKSARDGARKWFDFLEEDGRRKLVYGRVIDIYREKVLYYSVY
jgi:hypothetical protein